MIIKKLCSLGSASLLFFSSVGFSQETNGSISGQVTDERSAFLIGATVTAVHQPTGTRYGTTVNASGIYTLVNLRAGGPYTVRVTFVGYQSESKDDVNVSLGSVSLDFVVKSDLKTLREVVVKGAQIPGERKTGAGQRISSSQLRGLPSSSRSFQDYTKLTPQYNGNSFVGTNFRYNNVTIDGAVNNDAIGFSPSLGGQTGTSGQIGSSTRTNPISVEAIQDIQVYVAPYDVKIGNFTGGSINAVTRSGANNVEGAVFSYGRTGVFVGPDRAGGTKRLGSDFYDVQTGFRLGFPLIKDKLFFFTNFELTRRNEPVGETVKSDAAKSILSEEDVARISRYYGSSNFAFSPGTAGEYSIYSRSYKFFNKLDYNISDKHQLSVRSNVVTSQATNLTRDDQNFRFASIDYLQHNNQVATVAELRSRFSSRMANNLVFGYTSVKDYRDPSSDPYYPQIQIAGRALGTTVLLGTDREASIFNLKQKTLEFTDNLTLFRGRHTITFGTHNEFYKISYGFVNSPNGRIDYANVDDFILGRPSRIRGNYNYATGDRSYLLNHPSALFSVNLYSIYAQDEIVVSNRFRLVPGLRFDLADIPDKQKLSLKTVRAQRDLFYGTTFAYTPASLVKNNYLGQVEISPRLGFNYDVAGNKRLVFRGGTGLFTGRIPYAWLGYAFYNSGNDYGALDKRYNYVGNPTAIPPIPPVVPNPETDPRRPSSNGIVSTALAENNRSAVDPNGVTQVDLVDNHFKMPQVFRTSAAFDVNVGAGYKLTLEGVYTKTIYDVSFKQINLQDSASYYQYDRFKQQPIFTGKANDPLFTSVYLLSNTSKGYRYSLTAQLNKTFPFGLEFTSAYTYGESKDLANGIRNSMESNWQLNQGLNPNNPALAYSNFDTRHRIIALLNYRKAYGKSVRFQTAAALFFSSTSGAPFTYGFVNPPVSLQNTGQQVGLVYIPKPEEALNFFQTGNVTLSDGTVAFKTNSDQATEFYRYVRSVPYLNSRRGKFTERNAARTPWNTTADLRLSQTVFFGGGVRPQSVSFSADFFNLTNLVYSKWGRAYFSSDLFNSTASVGLRPTGRSQNGYPIYIWEQPAVPYQVDINQSRWQLQFGVRYGF